MSRVMDKSSKSKLTKNGDAISSAITIGALEKINRVMKGKGHLTTVDVQHIDVNISSLLAETLMN